MKNHASQIAAIDFLAVPTITFRLLYVFIVMSLERRHVLRFNVSQSPSACWTGQQIIEAFPYETAPRFLHETAPRFLLRDRDSIDGKDFVRRVGSTGVKQVVTARKSPWQNA